jgi:hypothetical protein
MVFNLFVLIFFSNQFQKAVNVWSLMPTFTSKNGSIYYRCLGYKAASYYRLKSYEESNLIYAQLYDEYEPQQLSSYRSFHLLEDSIWAHNIAIGKDNKTKREFMATVWYLCQSFKGPCIIFMS